MFIIRLAVSVLFLVNLTACGGGDGDDNTSSAASISIRSADIVDADGSKITSLPLNGSMEGFELNWQVNTNDLYYIEFFAGTQGSPQETRLLGRTCAQSDPGDLYGCNNSGRNWCEVTGPNRVSCELSGTRPENSAPHSSATHLTAKACTFGFLEDTCATRTLDVQLLQPTSEAPETGDSTPPGDDPVSPGTEEPAPPETADPNPPETEDPIIPGNDDSNNEEIETGTRPELEAENLIPPAVPRI